jgi:hypothetical protein
MYSPRERLVAHHRVRKVMSLRIDIVYKDEVNT